MLCAYKTKDDKYTYSDFKSSMDGKCSGSEMDHSNETTTFISYRRSQSMVSPIAAHFRKLYKRTCEIVRGHPKKDLGMIEEKNDYRY
jgi:hypothetical protein